MPRPRTGQISIERHLDHWDWRIELPDGTKSKRTCAPAAASKEDVKAEARHIKDVVWKHGGKLKTAGTRTPTTPVEGDTLDSYSDRWLNLRRDKKETGNHLRRYVLPILGLDTPLAKVTRSDVERVVMHLDALIKGGKLAWKSGANIWGTVTKMFDDATNAKDLALRALADRPNPTEKVRGPDRGEQKQSAYLWPKEAFALLACEAIPERWRVVYTAALYTGLRQGELAVLRVQDVVLEGGYLSVHKARDRATGGEKSTKGRRARRVPIEPNLRPLLLALVEGREGDALLFDMPPKQKMADELRVHLVRAGLDRAELHADTEHQRPLTFHDLRHSFATWLALRGENELTIQSRLGHADASMTQKYISEAESVGHGDIGTPFGELPQGLLEHKRKPPGNPTQAVLTTRNVSGVDGTRTRGLRRDRPAL